MSLIADALKAAQQERERRGSPEGPSAAAVLIPLRESRGRLGPARLLVILAVVVVAAAAALIWRDRGARSRLPSAPPLTSAILSDAIAADSARRAHSARRARPAPQPSRTQTGATTSRETPSGAAAVVVQSAAAATDTATTVLQGKADSPRQPASDEPARGELSVAVESRPSAERLFSQAVAAHRDGDLPTARALYLRVLAALPDHADALNNLGVILSGDQEFDRALEMLHRAAVLAPKNASTWNNIGTALREQGRSSEAIAAFRRALSIDPQHQGARVGLAQQYLAISALNEARTLLEHVVATNPTLAEAHYTLGQVLERQGDRPAAVRAYTTFVTVAPPRLAAHAERVRQYIETLSR